MRTISGIKRQIATTTPMIEGTGEYTENTCLE
jgi:hypothetical protein